MCKTNSSLSLKYNLIRSEGTMLQKFGFSQYESQAYEVVVSSNEPLDATTIVKHSGVPKAKYMKC